MSGCEHIRSLDVFSGASVAAKAGEGLQFADTRSAGTEWAPQHETSHAAARDGGLKRQDRADRKPTSATSLEPVMVRAVVDDALDILEPRVSLNTLLWVACESPVPS